MKKHLSKLKTSINVLLVLTLIFSAFLNPMLVNAKAGKLKQVKGIKATSTSNSVTLTWTKVKGAKTYKISQEKLAWSKWKKTSEGKYKKYKKNKNLYKVKKSGGKFYYKKYSNTYKVIKKVKGNSVTISGLRENTTYKFKIQAFVGKKSGKASKVTTVKTMSSSQNPSGGNNSSAPKIYTVKFVVDGKTISELKNVKSGSTIKAPSSPSQAGKVFEGWYYDAKFTNKYYSDDSIYNNVVLYAKMSDDYKAKNSQSITSDDFAVLSVDKKELTTDDDNEVAFYVKTSLSVDSITVTGDDGQSITLTDDGSDYDNLAYDGTYSGYAYIDNEEENLDGFSYQGTIKVGSQTLKTNSVNISVIRPFTYDELDCFTEVDYRLSDLYEDEDFATASIEERKAKAETVLQELLDQDYITGPLSYEDASYAYRFNYNVSGNIPGSFIIFEKESNIKGRIDVEPVQNNEAREKIKEEQSLGLLKADADIETGFTKKRVKVLHNFKNSGSSTSSAEDSWITNYNNYVSNTVGNISDIDTVTGATVEDYKLLSGYDAIIINSHGSYNDRENDPEICLREIATSDLDEQYQNDIKKKRIHRVVSGGSARYWLMPGFFPFYYSNQELDGAIVYLGCCLNYGDGSQDQDMARAWHNAGAGAVYAYLNSVDGTYDYNMLESVFSELADGKSTQEALSTAQSENGSTDGGSPAARMHLYETEDNYFIRGLMNGNFETLLKYWKQYGDVRALTFLSGIKPQSLPNMATITTGIGSVDDETSSSLSQTFIIPKDASTIKFKYDMVSEEPQEYVGSKYDDNFSVVLYNTNGTKLKSQTYESINKSTWYPISGINFPGGDSTTYHTRWKDGSIDVSAYRGQVVTIQFVVNDVGDSLYDTAVLLDNIKQN